MRLILASGSQARKHMLANAGVAFEVLPASIDEDAITSQMISESNCIAAADVASVLAREKALAVSRGNRDALVIGSDQVLAVGQRLISKAATLKDARETLEVLRGQTHELVSAVVLVSASQVVWQSLDQARLTMRGFSDAFLTEYLKRVGGRVLGSVGCYEIEGEGVQLFERIDGDHFTILGMPLVPLLHELRSRGVLQV